MCDIVKVDAMSRIDGLNDATHIVKVAFIRGKCPDLADFEDLTDVPHR